MKIREAIKKVAAKKDLTGAEMGSVFRDMMSGKTTPSQIGSFITALRMKGETAEEISAAAKVMREKAGKIKVSARSSELVDTCGTGGTGAKAVKTFNISTAAAFVLAGCGVKVAKHGNRAVSSECGSADVLAELGVKIEIFPSSTARCIDKIGIGFMFAPVFHSAMKYAGPVRREIGIRTIFNILGPLCNPLRAGRQLMGVYKKDLTEIMAHALKKLGSKRAYVVHGEGDMDEITLTGRTRISELRNGKVRTFHVSPASFGMKKIPSASIKGGDAKKNAEIIRGILSGKKGPKRDIVLANASFALMAAGKASDPLEGVRLAESAIDSGAALKKLESLITETNKGRTRR
ncbi:MAG: anthranilate phosphoribosyltransferase [Candidatus Omnitrophota bacterium]|nr:anthranilate phosphoribosyltransferase [Candidatus Omnitrophota bacterium]